MEEKSLVKVESNSLKEIGKRVMPKAVDSMKRVGKIIGGGSLAVLGLGAFAVGNVPVAAIGAVTFAGAGFRTISNIQHKPEPSLMFVSRRKKDEIQIFQDTRFNLAKHMKGYSASEKAGMMALQTLVGFSRYKENLKYSDYEIAENGQKIYMQKISTVTHGVNLKTLKMIEDLGYIKIDSMEDKFKQTIIEKALGREKRGLRKLLISEKIGFRNYKDLKTIFKAGVTGDKQTLESMRKDFQKVTFRLTDKKIDFDELYKKSADLSEIENKDERLALKRLSIIFDNEKGVLTTRNIDIGKDSFGRDIIKYNTKESLGARVKRENQIEEKREEFRDRLQENVNVEEMNREIIEQQIVQGRENNVENIR